MWDQHMHCIFSGDSEALPSDMINSAITKGLDGICFTDHLDYDYKEEPLQLDEFVAYLEASDSVKQKDLRLLERTTRYQDRFRNGGVVTKLLSSIRNPDILLANIIFKIRTKTPYGFNR